MTFSTAIASSSTDHSYNLLPPLLPPHLACAAFEHTRPLSAQGSTGSLDASPSAFAGGAGSAALLPPSAIYATSCRAFTWPLLAPQSQVGVRQVMWCV